GRGAHHRPLAAIDLHGGQFAGVIDPQDLGQARGLRASTWPWGNRLFGHRLARSRRAASTLSPARPSEISAFQPAMDRPANTQAASSQAGGFTLAPSRKAERSAAFTAPPPEAQACGPGQNYHSAS